MNNDKRIILAIAVYAAVMTMVLHTLSADAQERVLTNKISVTEKNLRYVDDCQEMHFLPENRQKASNEECIRH